MQPTGRYLSLCCCGDAFEMPDQVPYLQDGLTKYMKTDDFIKKELRAEMAVRDSIVASLADTSESGLIPSFVREVNKLHGKEKNSDRDNETNEYGKKVNNL